MTSHDKRSSARRKAKTAHPNSNTGSDAAVYVGLLMIGAFVIMLAWMVLQVPWTELLVGYVIAMAILINLYAWQAYLGKSLAQWQQSLARLPLRIPGYGTKHGKPLVAAKGQADARMTLMLFFAGSVLLVAALSVWLIR